MATANPSKPLAVEQYRALWANPGRLGTAEVVNWIQFDVVIKATPQTRTANVVHFRKLVDSVQVVPVVRLWTLLKTECVVLSNLPRFARLEVMAAAERCHLDAVIENTDRGGVSFFDHTGAEFGVPEGLEEEVLARMEKAGCRIERVEVD